MLLWEFRQGDRLPFWHHYAWCVWCMASVSPNLWLPSEPKSTATLPSLYSFPILLRLGRLSWPWWLVIYQDGNPQTVTSSSNLVDVISLSLMAVLQCFDTVSCVAGRASSPYKIPLMSCCLGYLSVARCIRLVYGLTDATATPSSLLPKIQNGLCFWYWPTQVVLVKRPLNECCCCCSCWWQHKLAVTLWP